MNKEEFDQTWTAAYAAAFAITTLGSAFSGHNLSPQEIDLRARELADKATETIAARATAAAARRKP